MTRRVVTNLSLPSWESDEKHIPTKNLFLGVPTTQVGDLVSLITSHHLRVLRWPVSQTGTSSEAADTAEKCWVAPNLSAPSPIDAKQLENAVNLLAVEQRCDLYSRLTGAVKSVGSSHTAVLTL